MTTPAPGTSPSDGDVPADLLARWIALLGPGAEAVGRDLLHRYAEPHRRYHTTAHLRAVLEAVDALAAEAADPRAVELGAWFHDAVYDPMAADNEERSAALAEDTLGGLMAAAADGAVEVERLSADDVAACARLVRLTAHHRIEAGDADGAVLCDADLAILAATPERYAAYAAAVREEYAAVDDAAFRAGRTAVLRGLLGGAGAGAGAGVGEGTGAGAGDGGAWIFHTALGRARFEERARRNLTTELELLQA